MSRFSGKVVLVTGGTSGIGRATAVAFAREGAKVVLSGRREKEGLAVAEAITTAGGSAHFVRADVANEADVKRLVDETVAKFGRLDVAFNNAGIEMVVPLTDATEADYRRVFDINVWGVVASMKHEIAAMLKTGGGAIVNTSSVVGHSGMANVALYSATKHAVEGLTKCAALEYAKQGVRVTAVAPAAIVTEMIDRFVGGEDTEPAKGLAAMHPVGRMGRAEEVAEAVLYLASENAKFTTGVSLPVDGGWLAQ
ncbi:glucose 1-dehydrogenase [Gemmata sp. JC673]|uniref:Glucose 1-dehydrogenase n=1 Tax=Gemmata algarum TaxID=2975278 RepID=A0ABU5EU62_9BACT|nr:glucose 1-dehydrogenase [Gemmata algarum]MDY3558843.1 glucose 1-dehydrogenase [Gemmata algarum]